MWFFITSVDFIILETLVSTRNGNVEHRIKPNKVFIMYIYKCMWAAVLGCLDLCKHFNSLCVSTFKTRILKI